MRQLALVAICLGLFTSWTLAEESSTSTPLPKTQSNEHDLVLRVTKQHFDDLTRDEFHVTAPIERALLSAWVSGVSQVHGRVKIEMESNENEAVFVATLDGSASATTVSSVRSIRIHGGGTTTFNVEKRILFDGVTYHGQPTAVSLTCDSHVSRIASTRRGILGRIVVGIARRRVPAMQPEVSRIMERDTRTHIRQEFDKLANQMIEELNKTTPIEKTIMWLFPETETWIYDLSTTDEYIQAGLGPKGSRFPELPKRGEGRQRDPVELWIRTEDAKAVTEVLGVWNVAQKVLETIEADDTDLPEPVQKQATAERVEDWVVITLGKVDGN